MKVITGITKGKNKKEGEEELLEKFIRIRLHELEEAILFYNNPPKEIKDPTTYLEGRGDALLESIFLHKQNLKKGEKIGNELKFEIENFFIKHEAFLRSVPLREVGGAPTIYRGLKDFVNYGVINSSREQWYWASGRKTSRKKEMTPQEKKFIKFIGQKGIDLQMISIGELHYELNCSKIKMGRTSVAKYLKKYRSR